VTWQWKHWKPKKRTMRLATHPYSRTAKSQKWKRRRWWRWRRWRWWRRRRRGSVWLVRFVRFQFSPQLFLLFFGGHHHHLLVLAQSNVTASAPGAHIGYTSSSSSSASVIRNLTFRASKERPVQRVWPSPHPSNWPTGCVYNC